MGERESCVQRRSSTALGTAREHDGSVRVPLATSASDDALSCDNRRSLTDFSHTRRELSVRCFKIEKRPLRRSGPQMCRCSADRPIT